MPVGCSPIMVTLEPGDALKMVTKGWHRAAMSRLAGCRAAISRARDITSCHEGSQMLGTFPLAI